MLYSEVKIGDKELKLRLDSRSCVALENRLGKSPLDIFSAAENGSLPRLEDMIAIFHAALQKYQHEITINKSYDLYDEYIENGGTMVDFIPLILDIFKVSGFFNEDKLNEVKEESGKK